MGGRELVRGRMGTEMTRAIETVLGWAERLREGDVVALSGTRESIGSALELLGADVLAEGEHGAAARA